jgi:hypothetical protein
VGLERGPLSLVSTIEELLGRNSSDFGLENRYYGRKGSTALTTRHPSLPAKKLALTSPTSGGRSVGIVRSRAQVTECFCFVSKCFLFRKATSVFGFESWEILYNFPGSSYAALPKNAFAVYSGISIYLYVLSSCTPILLVEVIWNYHWPQMFFCNTYIQNICVENNSCLWKINLS